MKRNIFFLALILAALGCKKSFNYALDQQVSPVATLISPQDSLYVNMAAATTGSVEFEWSPAQAADGSLVQYEIVFDTAGDNFKHPVYSTASDNTGENTTATISYTTLNQIAYLAGIPTLGTGNLYWAVYSTKGLNLVQSTQTRMITVTRAPGFAIIPDSVYLTGSATEAGAGFLPLQFISSGVFEIYTSLKPGGTYQFTDRISGTPTTYYLSGSKLLQTGSTTYGADTTAQVHFYLNFNNASASDTIVESVDVWYGIFDECTYHLWYNGASTWIDTGQLIQEPVESWGPEERYKFRYTVNAGSGDMYDWFGSSNGNNNEPVTGGPASYFYLYYVTNDQWNNEFKFSTPLNDNVKNTITVFMQPGNPYTHSVVPE